MKVINTKNAPAAVGPYSQAIKAGDTLYVSGQIPFDPKTMKCVEGGIKEQTKMSLTNVKNIIEEAGGKMENVVKTTILLDDMNDFADVNEVYGQFFNVHKPARACYEVAKLPLGVKVEIEAVVYLK